MKIKIIYSAIILASEVTVFNELDINCFSFFSYVVCVCICVIHVPEHVIYTETYYAAWFRTHCEI